MVLSWLKKMFGGSKRELSEPVVSGSVGSPTEAELLEEFRSYVSRELAAGYVSPEEALDYAMDVMSDELDLEIMKSKGPAILAAELAAQIGAQTGWPDVTDCDRLDAAFAALEQQGIVSRQNFTCCGTCGSAEIWDQMEDIRDAGGSVRGYTFFHQQDTESAVEGGGLYLNYGSVEEGSEASVAIGHEIQQILEANGLNTHWDGDIGRRIGVSLDWKRRIRRPASSTLN